MIDCPIQLAFMNTWVCRKPVINVFLQSLCFDNLQFSLKAAKNIPIDHNSEFENIQKARDGDEDAFRRIMEDYQSHVSKLLWRFTRDKNTHEELVQESFVQAYLSLHTYSAKAPFEHWLSRIATRTGYRFWKQSKQQSHISSIDDDWDQTAQEKIDEVTPQQAAELVHNLLSKLPPRDRLVLTLRYLDECSVLEVAERTGWTPALVKVQTHRAKQKLKKLLKNTDIQFEV